MKGKETGREREENGMSICLFYKEPSFSTTEPFFKKKKKKQQF